MGKWRAALLITVHVAIIGHIAQWLLSNTSDGVRNTISPVEPSEAMYTLEAGRLNAGFIMFSVAILATGLFGRFFCGWLCHIVALQDLCGWMMKKLGITPKPWRSRLLVWVPVCMGLYMFVWPTFRRVVLQPLAVSIFGEVPVWMGESLPLHGFTQHFIVEDYWATFPPWYVAIPFLLICGFAVVYFLGAKAFCFYGCPYGGIFGPVDRLAPVRIKVDDNCNSCGHCTAVCTSNVRVAEEVHNYGVVMDSGCMKCMDCVSACPNGALSVGLARPAIFTKPRDVEAAQASKARQQARYDLTVPEEIAFGIIFFAMFFGYRGLYGAIPLLMAAGFAAIGTFLVHKSWRLLRDANVRGPFRQLKLGGKLTPLGYVFALGTLVYAGIGVQGVIMHVGQWQGNMVYDRLDVPREAVFAPGYVPDPEIKRRAELALAWHAPSRAMTDGGVAFFTTWGENVRCSWLSAVAGDLKSAEAFLRAAIGEDEPRADLALGLIQMMRLRCATPQEIDAQFTDFVTRFPHADDIRAAFRDRLMAQGRRQEALKLYTDALALYPSDVETVNSAATTLLQLGRPADAEQTLRDGLKLRPRSPLLLGTLAQVVGSQRRLPEALDAVGRAVDNTPTAELLIRQADLTAASGKLDEAEAVIRRAVALELTPLTVQRLTRVQTARRVAPETIAPQLIELAENPSTSEAARQALGQQLVDIGRPDDAVAMYKRVLARGKPAAITVRNGAELMLLLGKPLDAKVILTEAIGGRHNSAGMLYGVYGTVLFSLGELDAAKSAFHRGRELLPNMDPIGKLADELARLGRNAELEDLYVDAVNRSPRHVPTRINAAGLGLTIQRADVAIENAEMGLKVDPCNPTLLDYAGRGYFLAGKEDLAIERLRAAAELEPTADRWNQLADIYQRQGKQAEAQDALTKAAAFGAVNR